MNLEFFNEFAQKYLALKQEAIAFTVAIEAIREADPKSEFIMPLATKLRELMSEVMSLSKTLDEGAGDRVNDPRTILFRKQLELVHDRVMRELDQYIREADGQ